MWRLGLFLYLRQVLDDLALMSLAKRLGFVLPLLVAG